MVIFLPVVLLLFVAALARGDASLVLLLPTAVVLGAGAVVVSIALRDGRPRRDPSVRLLPTDHLRRQMHRALRPPSARPRPARRPKGE